MRSVASAIALLALAGSAFAQASFNNAGYTQNFDGITATGTATPTGWSIWTLAGSNATFTNTTGIPVASVAGGTQTSPTGALGILNQNITTPIAGANNNNGVNAGFTSNLSDRKLGTSSTTPASAGVIQLVVSNDTLAIIPSLTISYDTFILTRRTAVDELQGYRFFYSLSGSAGPFTAVTALDADTTSTSLAVGSSLSVSSTISIPGGWAPGAQITLRWVDDNAAQNSPDSQVAIDNVSVVPTPGSTALLALAGLATRRRRTR